MEPSRKTIPPIMRTLATALFPLLLPVVELVSPAE
jgi:hypothetical protein